MALRLPHGFVPGGSHYPCQAMLGGRRRGVGTRYTHAYGPKLGDQWDPLWHQGNRPRLFRGLAAMGGHGRDRDLLLNRGGWVIPFPCRPVPMPRGVA